MERKKSSPYRQLNELKRQFRLLRLCNSDPQCLRCELETFSLADGDLPPWKALSYRWGDDEPNFVTYLNDEAIPIRKNLYKIMTQMATEGRRDWIFIDALCINQENEAEKPGQVALMGELYRQADEVVTWVVYEPDEDQEEDAEGPTYDPYQSPSVWRAQLEDAVLQNSYWSRLWIVQEVLLAKALVIRMGAIEVDWLNLLPEKSRRGLPENNRNLGVREVPDTHTLKTLNAVRFDRQCCGRPHDRIFGYLGLTNSRVHVDYSLSVLDLFVATLADYMLSAGFITEDLSAIRRRKEMMKKSNIIMKGNDLIAPVLAFDLDFEDPVVCLLFHSVVQFFAPGVEEGICGIAIGAWGAIRRWSGREEELQDWIENGDHKWELRYIGSVCIKVVKVIASEVSAGRTYHKGIVARQKAFGEEDAVLMASGGGEMKKYSEWVAHARGISEQMWKRFQESGEDTDGDMEDESWTLIA